MVLGVEWLDNWQRVKLRLVSDSCLPRSFDFCTLQLIFTGVMGLELDVNNVDKLSS